MCVNFKTYFTILFLKGVKYLQLFFDLRYLKRIIFFRNSLDTIKNSTVKLSLLNLVYLKKEKLTGLDNKNSKR